MNSFKSIFLKFPEELLFRKGFLSNSYQCQISKEHLSVVVSIFYISCELKTPNIPSFFNIFVWAHPRMTNVVISWRRPMRLNMLYCTGMVPHYHVTCCNQFISEPCLWINPTYDTSVRCPQVQYILINLQDIVKNIS